MVANFILLSTLSQRMRVLVLLHFMVPQKYQETHTSTGSMQDDLYQSRYMSIPQLYCEQLHDKTTLQCAFTKTGTINIYMFL